MITDDSEDSDGRTAARVHPNGTEWIHYIPNDVRPQDLPLKDISTQAIWTLSSCKTDGYGIYELLDDSVERYWQSDGPQPHTVTIEFPKKTDISFLCLYLDFKNDESYTPSKVCVYTGTCLMHLNEGVEKSFSEPMGWQYIDLRTTKLLPVRANVIQLQVIQNHQNGRDTHIRHIRVIGPTSSRFDSSRRILAGNLTDYRSRPMSEIYRICNPTDVIR